MKGRVVRFTSRADSLRLDQAAELRQLVLPWEDQAPVAVSRLLAMIDRHTAASKGWTFIMLSAEQHQTVCLWIEDHAKRPWVSMRLWNAMYCHLRMDTNFIIMDRKQMMDAAKANSASISNALSELVEFGALIRHQEGHEVFWEMNPMIGTCMTGKAREDAQKAAPRLKVVTNTLPQRGH